MADPSGDDAKSTAAPWVHATLNEDTFKTAVLSLISLGQPAESFLQPLRDDPLIPPSLKLAAVNWVVSATSRCYDNQIKEYQDGMKRKMRPASHALALEIACQVYNQLTGHRVVPFTAHPEDGLN